MTTIEGLAVAAVLALFAALMLVMAISDSGSSAVDMREAPPGE